ncbi:TetR/AcrR family transcriptional regulator [Gordonia sp. NPDC003504]
MGSVTRTHSGHGPRRRAEITRRVLDAVEELLSSGERFTELPVQRIAEHSGMSRTNFYQYFPNKSHLLIQVAEVASAKLFAAPASWFADDASLDAGVAGVESAVAAMIAETRGHWPLMRAVAEVAAYDPEVAEFYHGRIGVFVDFAYGKVAHWQAAGRVDPVVTRESVAAITWMVERAATQHIMAVGDDTSGDAAVAAAQARIIWLTITAGPE